jgi:hypothetical protein
MSVMADTASALDTMSLELTPTAYLDRAAAAHGDRIGVVDGRARAAVPRSRLEV